MIQLAYVGGLGLMAGPAGTHRNPMALPGYSACTTVATLGRREMPFAPAGKPTALSL